MSNDVFIDVIGYVRGNHVCFCLSIVQPVTHTHTPFEERDDVKDTEAR